MARVRKMKVDGRVAGTAGIIIKSWPIEALKSIALQFAPAAQRVKRG
jgi:hypothetical protein